MELSKQSLDYLSQGHSNGTISDENFIKIVNFTYNSLNSTFSTKTEQNDIFLTLFSLSWENFSSLSNPSQKTSQSLELNPSVKFYMGLSTILTESARFDVSANELKGVLDEKIDQNRADLILEEFKKHNKKLRFELTRHSVRLNQLIDFSWRLDYNVHSNALDEMREQKYVLVFTFLDAKDSANGGDGKRTVTCQADLADVNSLLIELKHAIAKKI